MRKTLRTLLSVLAIAGSTIPITSGTAAASSVSASSSCQRTFSWPGTAEVRRYPGTGWCLQYDDKYQLRYEANGNLVYRKGSTVVWSSNTARTGTVLKFGANGNIAIYAGAVRLWTAGSSGTCRGPFSTELEYFGLDREWIAFQVHGCVTRTVAAAAK
jgi:hypothetical protein